MMTKRLIGYMITWTTYGTWLQSDNRRYVKDGKILPGNDRLKFANQKQQKFPTVRLNAKQRQIAEEAILQEAQKINQAIPAIAVCSNHVHIVAKASAESIEQAVHRYKRLATFVLRKAGLNGKIWSTGFDKRFCFTDKDIEQKVKYVNGHKIMFSPAILHGRVGNNHNNERRH
jgi:REP element-mobilizing transposase RayT